jgi:hypothetical protein
MLEHPAEIDAYLADQERVLERIKMQYPMSQELIDRLDLAQKEITPRVA